MERHRGHRHGECCDLALAPSESGRVDLGRSMVGTNATTTEGDETMTTPKNNPLFQAEDLRQIERVNAEIERVSKSGKTVKPLPLFDDQDD